MSRSGPVYVCLFSVCTCFDYVSSLEFLCVRYEAAAGLVLFLRWGMFNQIEVDVVSHSFISFWCFSYRLNFKPCVWYVKGMQTHICTAWWFFVYCCCCYFVLLLLHFTSFLFCVYTRCTAEAAECWQGHKYRRDDRFDIAQERSISDILMVNNKLKCMLYFSNGVQTQQFI